MNKVLNNKLVPKLRFVEFKDTEGWDKDVLDGNFNTLFINDKMSLDELQLESYVSTENLLPNYEGKTISSKLPSTGSVTQFKKEDILLSNIRPYLKKVWFANIDGGASNDVIVIRAGSKIDPSFLSFILKNDTFINYIMKSVEGVKMPRGDKDLIKKYPIIIPKKPEQQKIANCLSSLDDVITAESQKLETLKMQKKGLMQQLFPAEGEILPKYRFKEFGNTGGWKKVLFSDIAKITTGNKDTQNKVSNGKYPFFVRSQNVERIDSFSYDGEAILTSGDGVGVGKNYHYINGRFDFHQRVYCIYDFANDINGKYVYLYFSEHFYNRVMRMNAKNSVDSVRMGMIAEMPIFLPKQTEEQNKIADCLWSIDELISLQNLKVDVLRAHKKGLIEQLFPNLTEISE